MQECLLKTQSKKTFDPLTTKKMNKKWKLVNNDEKKGIRTRKRKLLTVSESLRVPCVASPHWVQKNNRGGHLVCASLLSSRLEFHGRQRQASCSQPAPNPFPPPYHLQPPPGPHQTPGLTPSSRRLPLQSER